MPEYPPHATDPVHPKVRFEKRDADTSGVLLFGAVLVMAAIIGHVIVWGVLRSLEKREAARTPPLPGIAKELPSFPEDLGRIPEPRLQIRDIDDMAALRRQENAKLEGKPAWVDRDKGIVRIPIQEAMRRLRTDPSAAAANGVRFREPREKKR
jgi:hypothetical protein